MRDAHFAREAHLLQGKQTSSEREREQLQFAALACRLLAAQLLVLLLLLAQLNWLPSAPFHRQLGHTRAPLAPNQFGDAKRRPRRRPSRQLRAAESWPRGCPRSAPLEQIEERYQHRSPVRRQLAKTETTKSEFRRREMPTQSERARDSTRTRKPMTTFWSGRCGRLRRRTAVRICLLIYGNVCIWKSLAAARVLRRRRRRCAATRALRSRRRAITESS